MGFVFVVTYEYRVYGDHDEYRSRWIDAVSGVFATFEEAQNYVFSEIVKEKANDFFTDAGLEEHVTYRVTRWAMQDNTRKDVLVLESEL